MSRRLGVRVRIVKKWREHKACSKRAGNCTPASILREILHKILRAYPEAPDIPPTGETRDLYAEGRLHIIQINS